jgi:hypothetical protein
MIVLECPYCSAQIQLAEGRAGRSITCPFCKGQVEAPKPHKSKPPDEYDFRDEAEPRESASMVGLLTAADVEALEQEEPPQKKKRRRPRMEWQLVVGGFGFPFSPGAVKRWLLIAIWAALTGWLVHSAVAMGIGQSLGTGDISRTIAALLAACGAMIASVACVGVAGIHGLTILLETTAGNDRIECWPNVGLFLEWAGQLWFLFNAALLSVLLGLGLHWMLRGTLPSREAIVAATVFFTFPILLLCVLESDSPFLPVSAAVLVSLVRHALAWFAFYLQAGGLLGIAAAMGYFLAPRLDLRLLIPLAALFFSAVVMIYFRLLGRLAFYCTIEPELEPGEE